MIQVKIFVTTENHKTLENEINAFIKEMAEKHFYIEIKDITLNDNPETEHFDGSYSAMMIYETFEED